MSLSHTKQIHDSNGKAIIFNVAEIKHLCLSNGCHSVRFLNGFENLFNHRTGHQKCFSLLDVQLINSALTFLLLI